MQSNTLPASPKGYFFQTLFSSPVGLIGFVLELVSTVFLMVGAGFWVASFSNSSLRPMGWTFLGLGLGLSLISLPFLLKIVRQAQNTAEIHQNGLETTGHVINLRRNRALRVNGQHPLLVTYSYTVNGERFEGQQNVWESPVQAGETAVVVKYHPQQPHESRLQRT